MPNMHDNLFKATFEDIEVTTDFLKQNLPEEIKQIVDLNKLEIQKGSAVDEALKGSYTDLLFKTTIQGEEGYFYFLFEHKSYIDKNIPFQLLKYLVRIWEKTADKTKENVWKLPVIIPLVVYHGGTEWKLSIRLNSMVKGYPDLPSAVKTMIPDFDYGIHDLSHLSNDEIKGAAKLKIYTHLVRALFNPAYRNEREEIFTALVYFEGIEDKVSGLEYFRTVMYYLFHVDKNLTAEDTERMQKVTKNTYLEGSDVIMTLAEKYMEKGMEKGRKEGREEGREEGEISRSKMIALTMLRDGLSVEKVAGYTNLPKEKVKELGENLK